MHRFRKVGQGCRERGFTLVEVLVALLVISLAIGGSLGLLVEALRTQRSALWHTQAALLAADLAERIRANSAAGAAYAGAPADLGCDTRSCAPADRAQQDLHDWRAATVAALPIDLARDQALQIGYLGASAAMQADEYRIRLGWRDPAAASEATHAVAMLIAPSASRP